MRVQTRDGRWHEGVLHSAVAAAPALAIVLKQAREVAPSDAWAAPYTAQATPMLVVRSADFVQLEARDVDPRVW